MYGCIDTVILWLLWKFSVVLVSDQHTVATFISAVSTVFDITQLGMGVPVHPLLVYPLFMLLIISTRSDAEKKQGILVSTLPLIVLVTVLLPIVVAVIPMSGMDYLSRNRIEMLPRLGYGCSFIGHLFLP